MVGTSADWRLPQKRLLKTIWFDGTTNSNLSGCFEWFQFLTKTSCKHRKRKTSRKTCLFFFNEIRLAASEIASLWNTLMRMKYLLRKCYRRILFHILPTAKYFIIRQDYFTSHSDISLHTMLCIDFAHPHPIVILDCMWYNQFDKYGITGEICCV